MFEGALKTFEIKRPEIAEKAADRKAKTPEEKLREKDNVIAELASPTALARKF